MCLQRRQTDLHNAIGVPHQQCTCMVGLLPTEQHCVSLLMLFNVVLLSAQTPCFNTMTEQTYVICFIC